MIKRRLKSKYLFALIGIFVLIPLATLAMYITSDLNTDVKVEPDHITKEVINDSLPVVNPTTRIINPYLDNSVKVEKNYYDYQKEAEEQIKSIIVHDNTYTQNTGIDYTAENKFDVVAILDGSVLEVKDDETLGKSVEIKHDNGIISIYQSLSELKVKKGDIITQGQVIGISGENELDKDLGNHLHFEIYENGSSVNPENYLNKEVSIKKEN